MPWAEELPSGKYRALYRDRNGKRRSAGTFDHKKRAENAAAAAEADARKLGWRDPNAALRTWGSWCDEWWPTRPVEPGTLQRDAYRRDKYLLPRWGTTALVDITRHDVKAWATSLGADLAPASVQRIVYMFSASLAAAIDAEIITVNPAYRIKITKGETTAQRYLTHDEYSLVDEQLPTDFDQALAAVLVGTGMRWGEATGLQLQRIDFTRAIARVAETWDDTMRRVKPYPKGRRIRDVPIPDWVLERIVPLAQGRTRGLLFERNGMMPIASNWRSRVWVPAVDQSGIGHVRVHDLRHTYASWLIQSGLPLAEVGKLMGHESPMTTQMYAHLQDTDSAKVLRALPRPTRGADVGQTSATSDYTPLRSITPRTAESQGS